MMLFTHLPQTSDKLSVAEHIEKSQKIIKIYDRTSENDRKSEKPLSQHTRPIFLTPPPFRTFKKD